MSSLSLKEIKNRIDELYNDAVTVRKDELYNDAVTVTRN